MMTRIHINKHHIKHNKIHKNKKPVFTVKQGGKTRYTNNVKILGPSELVYSDCELSCGANAWLETESEVILENEMSFTDTKQIK